jgi:hypothetical protein
MEKQVEETLRYLDQLCADYVASLPLSARGPVQQTVKNCFSVLVEKLKQPSEKKAE